MVLNALETTLGTAVADDAAIQDELSAVLGKPVEVVETPIPVHVCLNGSLGPGTSTHDLVNAGDGITIRPDEPMMVMVMLSLKPGEALELYIDR
jgi:uncharacterized protein YbjT (DUF2867 family)